MGHHPLPDVTDPPREEVVVYVCVTCRPAGLPDDAARPGRRLHAMLMAAISAGEGAPVRVEAVECLSVCRRPCTIAVTAPRRWTYVYGDLDPEASLPALLDGLSRYAASADGLVPWRERPDIFRKGVVARLPPSSARLDGHR
jgi:predicted metal-binding protein